MQKPRILTILLTLILCAAPFLAHADSSSMVTGAVGTHLGVTNTYQLDNSQSNQFVSELQLKGRFFKALGVEIAFNPSAAANQSEQELVFSSRFRFAAQLFILPLDATSIYLKAGVGADNVADVFDLSGDKASYQGGMGFEVYIGEHLAIGFEYLMIVPGIRSIQRSVINHALHTGIPDSALRGPSVKTQKLDAWDFVHPRNFQTTLGMLYYF